MQLRFAIAGLVATILIAGCHGSEPGDAPGKEAGVKKDYTKEDALSIKPKRGGSEEPGK